MDEIIYFLRSINDVITAGAAIVCFSLLIYVLTFKLRDRVTWSFTFLLCCVVIIFGADAFLSATNTQSFSLLILRVQYIGLIFLTVAYFNFSDALLEMTGKPSRGKRRVVLYASIITSMMFLALNFLGILFSDIDFQGSPAPHIERTITHDVFSVFFFLMMILSWYNFFRAVRRTKIKTSRRRMIYLIISAVGPALGSFPFLLYGYEFAARNSAVFWFISIVVVAFVIVSTIGMAYAVSFFGFPWPDRVIKSRLFKWLMRGPVTASLTLGVTTMITRIGNSLGSDISHLVIIGMVASIVIFEFFVTIFSPFWERMLFDGRDRDELQIIRQLEDQLLTKKDLEQFLELILATLCDRLQISGAVLFEQKNGQTVLTHSSGRKIRNIDKEKENIFSEIKEDDEILTYGNYTVFPLAFSDEENGERFLGFLVLPEVDLESIEDEKLDAVWQLVGRTASAIFERRKQEDLLSSLEILTPQALQIQTMMAYSRFNQSRILNGHASTHLNEMALWVRDALAHYYGGPKLSRNPLMGLAIVREKMQDGQRSSINALREALGEGILKLRPEGERQYTNEWILFNILDLKFIEGWKVKDISRKLALSEADFYRKQRTAISALSEELMEMERIKTASNA